jgi:hypothetical protein
MAGMAGQCFLGWYLPRGEPRPIPEGAIIHQSVVDRMAEVPSYRPINIPFSYTTEPGPTPPVEGSEDTVGRDASIGKDDNPN